MDFKVRLTYFQIMALLGHLDSTWEGVKLAEKFQLQYLQPFLLNMRHLLWAIFEVELPAELDYTLQIPLHHYTHNEPLELLIPFQCLLPKGSNWLS